MKTLTACLSLALTCSVALAQGQLVRGKVEDVRNTQNQFFLDCTNIPLTSAALNLNLMVGQQFDLMVQNVGTPQNPVLEVTAATPVAKMFDMGNLRLGRSDTWEATGAPGEFVFFFVGGTANTAYQPFGNAGTWLLGPDSLTLVQGVVSPLGVFQTRIAPPNNPGLVGLSFSAQALIGSPRTSWRLSNADCKDVRSN